MNNRERQPVFKRILSKIKLINGCHVWTGHRHKDGYGLIRISRRARLVHRVVYAMNIGPTMGLRVLHHCDNPPCCNPNHLFVGTDEDNRTDKMQKNRQAKGDKIGKLRSVDVINIRLLGRDDVRILTHVELGQMFGVSGGQVGKILAKKQWKHL